MSLLRMKKIWVYSYDLSLPHVMGAWFRGKSLSVCPLKKGVLSPPDSDFFSRIDKFLACWEKMMDLLKYTTVFHTLLYYHT